MEIRLIKQKICQVFTIFSNVKFFFCIAKSLSILKMECWHLCYWIFLLQTRRNEFCFVCTELKFLDTLKINPTHFSYPTLFSSQNFKCQVNCSIWFSDMSVGLQTKCQTLLEPSSNRMLMLSPEMPVNQFESNTSFLILLCVWHDSKYQMMLFISAISWPSSLMSPLCCVGISCANDVHFESARLPQSHEMVRQLVF